MTSFSCKVISFLIILCLVTSSTRAQVYPITHYTKDRGLPGNQILSIFQDSKGYMWFTTSAGVIKYNGKDYKIIDKELTVSHNKIAISEDKNGRMFFTHEMGVCLYSEKQVRNWNLTENENDFRIYHDKYDRIWIFSSFFPSDIFYFQSDSLHNFSKENNFKNQELCNMAEDREGGIFFLTRKGELYRYFAGNIKEIFKSDLLSSKVNYVFFDSDNNFIICSDAGLGIINRKDLYHNPEIKWIMKTPVNFGLESKRGYFWFASGNGIYRFRTPLQDKHILNITEKNGLLSNDIYSLYEDSEGNIWIAHAASGLSKISSLMFSKYGKPEGLESDGILAISKLNESLLISAIRGIFSFQNNSFNKVSVDYSRGLWFVCSFALNDKEILLGTNHGIYRLERNASLTYLGLGKNIIYDIMKDRQDRIWIGTNEGVYTTEPGNRFVKQDYCTSDQVSKILEVKSGDIYLGTKNGLIILRNSSENTDKRNVIHSFKEGPLAGSILDIIEDSDGTIIAATRKGLAVLKENYQVENIKEFNNVEVINLYLDKNKRLWVGTSSSGLFRLIKNNGDYTVSANFSKSEGLPSNEFTKSGTIYEDKDKKIYFGMFGGLSVYDPEEENNIFEKPRTYITDVNINDSTFRYDQIFNSELSYSQNKVKFICDGLSFFNEDRVYFEYYLSNIEKEWSNTSANHEIAYGYLEPGEYTFFVRAVNQFGVASESQSLSFVILSPFWKRPWFIILSVIILVTSGYQVNHYRQKNIRRRNAQLEQIVKEKTLDLEESKKQVEIQYVDLLEAQKELVEKRELEKAHVEIQLLKDRLAKENIYLREKQGSMLEASSIIGRSSYVVELRRKVAEIAGTDTTVLLTGETGVGKNLVAEAIHGSSLRKDRALVTVNCASIPDSLVESELFGHEKGAFTGAEGCRIGKFEVADGSTIFLDEIGDMNLAVQAKLLSVLQSKKLVRIGSNKEIKLDVRIIAATNHDLAELVKQGKFRQDLFYRINVYSIHLKPIREYPEDIEPVAKFFIDRFSKILNKKISAVTRSALNILKNYSYPGNIRELENIIHRAVIVAKNEVISDEDILIYATRQIRTTEDSFDGDLITLDEIEKKYIMHVLLKTKGKISGSDGAAEILGLNASTLRSRMKKLGINSPT